MKDDGETSIVEPTGKTLNRGDDIPSNVDAADGVGDRTRLKRGCRFGVDLIPKEVTLSWAPIITSCQPISFFLGQMRSMDGQERDGHT